MEDRKVVAWGECHNSWVSKVAFDSYWSPPTSKDESEKAVQRFGYVGQVLHDTHARKDELKSRAVALKVLGKIFQREKLSQSVEMSKKKTVVDVTDDTSSSDSSDDEDSTRTVNFRAPLITQGIGRLFRCLCNPAYDVEDDDEIVYKSNK